MSEVVEVPVLPDKQGRPPLDAVVNAQLQIEKWESRTRLLHGFLVAVSVAMAYRLFAGSDGRTLGVTLVLSAWLVTFVALFVCGEAGRRSLRRRDRMLSAVGGQRR
jgi:hypothetical protein